uniref:Zinc finger, CCHC-type n=1 Tax=Heterorhabditis bacteriophora TaxID=37862 RepID=A0A1I7XEQ6_HETBA
MQFIFRDSKSESNSIRKKFSTAIEQEISDGKKSISELYIYLLLLLFEFNSNTNNFKGRLKSFSERAVHKVKTFVSRPINETTMQRFITKLEARKHADQASRSNNSKLSHGEDVYPNTKNKVYQSRKKQGPSDVR